jgi:hypothetical protein
VQVTVSGTMAPLIRASVWCSELWEMTAGWGSAEVPTLGMHHQFPISGLSGSPGGDCSLSCRCLVQVFPRREVVFSIWFPDAALERNCSLGLVLVCTGFHCARVRLATGLSP